VKADGVTVEVTDGIATVTPSTPPVKALGQGARAGPIHLKRFAA
jgi:hypothetical protein